MTEQQTELLRRIAVALETIVERMPTWQTMYPRDYSVPIRPNDLSRCPNCGGVHHMNGLPCPSLTPFAGRRP